jgi:ribosomal protein S18 acetylase RimI-like enzyme
VFPAERLDGLEAIRERRQRFWHETIESPPDRTHTLVAQQLAEVVGFASLGRSRDDEALGELYAIYVLPAAWGGGAGPALMAEGLERLRGSGFQEAVLWVLEDNPRARAFYQRSGWALDGQARAETFLDTFVGEVRYRIALDAAG